MTSLQHPQEQQITDTNLQSLFCDTMYWFFHMIEKHGQDTPDISDTVHNYWKLYQAFNQIELWTIWQYFKMHDCEEKKVFCLISQLQPYQGSKIVMFDLQFIDDIPTAWKRAANHLYQSPKFVLW